MSIEDPKTDPAVDQTKTPESVPAPTPPAGEKSPESTPAAVKAEPIAIKAPEGFDKDFVAGVEADAKELGLSAAQAQKLFDKIVADRTKAEETSKSTLATWEKEFKEDPDFGRDKLERSEKAVTIAISKFASERDLAELKALGADKAPSVRRVLARIGAQFLDDTVKKSDPVVPEVKEERSWYTFMKSK